MNVPVTSRPVAAYVFNSESIGLYETVVCDNGAVFYRPVGQTNWQEDTPIPGTIRHYEKEQKGNEE